MADSGDMYCICMINSLSDGHVVHSGLDAVAFPDGVDAFHLQCVLCPHKKS